MEDVVTTDWEHRKFQIGYALSGGFIKGFAHLGVMQALLEHDIRPDIISGVSAGALAGVFYANLTKSWITFPDINFKILQKW